MTVFADLHVVVDPLVGGRCWAAGYVPPEHEYPYVSVLVDPFDMTSALDGDSKALAYRSFVQLDLWERVGAESPTLLRRMVQAVDGLALTRPRLRARLRSSVRVPEPPATELVHHAVTLGIVESTTVTAAPADPG